MPVGLLHFLLGSADRVTMTGGQTQKAMRAQQTMAKRSSSQPQENMIHSPPRRRPAWSVGSLKRIFLYVDGCGIAAPRPAPSALKSTSQSLVSLLHIPKATGKTCHCQQTGEFDRHNTPATIGYSWGFGFQPAVKDASDAAVEP